MLHYSQKAKRSGRCIVLAYIVDNVYVTPTGAWIFKTLKISFPQTTCIQQPGDNSEETDASGLGIESPHKALAAANDKPCNIPGVGDVRSMWVGQQGVHEIRNMLEEEKRRKTHDITVMSVSIRVLESF